MNCYSQLLLPSVTGNQIKLHKIGGSYEKHLHLAVLSVVRCAASLSGMTWEVGMLYNNGTLYMSVHEEDRKSGGGPEATVCLITSIFRIRKS